MSHNDLVGNSLLLHSQNTPWEISVTVVTGLHAGRLRIRGSVPDRSKRLLQNFTSSGPTHSKGSGGLFSLVVKWLGHEGDYVIPSRAKVKHKVNLTQYMHSTQTDGLLIMSDLSVVALTDVRNNHNTSN